ncbi:pseudouridine synthase [Rubripirellula reticaptiva]|uniref:Pseudouridine synthase n=1 Tax=Rubripirellula reticaptiva TaxID=2528013 RepID=A0A5C6F7U2_9BACT|nr:pseudouridine synthase [Rubripirellula reticaptiva]TWU56156.1 Ribosomal large subunit pseudouridine synthase B [Rubripirellula reticaptiva]
MPRKTAQKRPANSTEESSSLRLQRVLAGAGFGSRRQCEELIEDGRVHVDGVVVDKLGTTVDASVQKILVDGQPLRKQKVVYYAVNKPVGVVTTNRDPQGRPRVVDLVPPDERVFPVGRLDLSSEGLIVLTNDGELAQKLTHPSIGVKKIYRVVVAGKVENETMKKMREGIYIAEGFVKVDGAKLLKAKARSTELEITLSEGKNREIRRILARLGHKVQQLRRIAVGPLKLGDIPPGAYRVLRREEIDKLWATIEAAENTPTPRHTKKKTAGPGRSTKKKASTKFGGATKKFTGSNAKSGGKTTVRSAGKSTGKKAGPATKSAAPLNTPIKPSGSGAIIGGDSKPLVDRSKLKEHVVKARPTGAQRKEAAGGTDSRSAGGRGKPTKGRPGKGRTNQRRTKKR